MKRAGDAKLIESKVKGYIRRYYALKTLSGIIYSLIFLILTIGLLFILDWLFFDENANKIVFFIILIFLNGGFFIYKTGVPILKWAGFIKGIDLFEAGKLIAENASGIDDRIINIIELEREKQPGKVLYEEAIHQKSERIKWVDFNRTLSLKDIYRGFIRISVLALLSGLIVVLWPDFVKKEIGKIILLKEPVSAASISFRIESMPLKVVAGEDYTLRFSLVGSSSEEITEIRVGDRRLIPLKANGYYEHVFRSVNSPVIFRLAHGAVQSDIYRIEVIRKPELSSLMMLINPPVHTGLESFRHEGDGNVEVPEGSEIRWMIKAVFAEEIRMVLDDTITGVPVNGSVEFRKTINKTIDYEIITAGSDSLETHYFFAIRSIADLHPEIDIVERTDSLIPGRVFIEGSIQDDYGVSRLELIAESDFNRTNKEISILGNALFQVFYESIEPDTTGTSYYFRVWDNDRVKGPKFTDSRRLLIRKKNMSELIQENEERGEKIKEKIDEGLGSIDELEEKIMQLRMERLAGTLKPWEVQERMKEINDIKENLMQMIENVQKENQAFSEMEEMAGVKEEIVEKSRQITEMMEELIDEELKELMEQFKELEKEFREREAMDATEKMEMNLEKLKEQMEMGLELLKRYDVEKKLLEESEKLGQIAEEIEKKIEEKNQSKIDTSAQKNQEKFEDWKNEFNSIKEKNEELKEPYDIAGKSEEIDEIEKLMKEFSNTQNEERNSKGSEASAKMKKLANDIREMAGGMQEGAQTVDVEELRMIRNSLNDFSKMQETLNTRIAGITPANPLMGESMREQKRLEDKFSMIRDSLKSLGFKEPIIARMLGQELFHVETSFKNLFSNYSEGRTAQVRIEQNRIMNEVNIVVLKLDELIKSAENQKGSGSGKKGFTDSRRKEKGDQKGSEKVGESRQKQESLKEQLKGAIRQMQEGKTGKEGRKQLSKMLGEREMMRRMTERLSQGGMLGQEARERLMQAIEMMKEVEKDIVYNRMGDHTLEKDEWIRTRLLEAENAERERENENRRESKEFKGEFSPNTLIIQEDKRENKPFRQTLKYKELKLRKYYQEKYEKYLESTRRE